MDVMTLHVDKPFCGDCMFGLRRFIQGIDGVQSVEIAGQTISIVFDGSVMKENTLRGIAINSIERIGYRVET
jgi:copper chaperone CopZ